MKFIKFILKLNNNNSYLLIPNFFIGYIFAGIASVIAYILIQLLLLNYLKLSYFYSHTISSILCIYVGYKINKIFTFKIRKSKTKNKLFLYYLTNLLSIIANVIAANHVFKITTIWYLSSFVGIAIAAIFNFLSYKYIIWKESK